MFLAAVASGNKTCSVRFGIGKCSPFSIYLGKKKRKKRKIFCLVKFPCQKSWYLIVSFLLPGVFLNFFFLYVSTVSYAKSGVMNSHISTRTACCELADIFISGLCFPSIEGNKIYKIKRAILTQVTSCFLVYCILLSSGNSVYGHFISIFNTVPKIL